MVSLGPRANNSTRAPSALSEESEEKAESPSGVLRRGVDICGLDRYFVRDTLWQCGLLPNLPPLAEWSVGNHYRVLTFVIAAALRGRRFG